MSQDQKGGDNLANKLFAGAFQQKAEGHLQKAKDALSRGANEQASEHLKRVQESTSNLFFNPSSPRLSEAENDEYRRLTNQRFYKTESGLIGENSISDSLYNRFQFLDKKARGQQ